MRGWGHCRHWVAKPGDGRPRAFGRGCCAPEIPDPCALPDMTQNVVEDVQSDARDPRPGSTLLPLRPELAGPPTLIGENLACFLARPVHSFGTGPGGIFASRWQCCPPMLRQSNCASSRRSISASASPIDRTPLARQHHRRLLQELPAPAGTAHRTSPSAAGSCSRPRRARGGGACGTPRVAVEPGAVGVRGAVEPLPRVVHGASPPKARVTAVTGHAP